MIILRPHTSSRAGRKHKLPGALAAVLLVITGVAAAEEAAWHLFPAPTFMRPDFATPVANSKTMVVAPGLLRGLETSFLTRAEADRLKLDLASVRRVAQANARAELAKLEPEYVRDARGVILFARLDGPRPTVASAVLAPEFAERFRDTLGPDLLVAIPNRYRVYVYPALAETYNDTAELVLRDYEMSGERVSRELFRLTPEGLRAVGEFKLP